MIELIPIVIVAAGVTVVVGVTAYIVSEMSKPKTDDEAEKERCRKVKTQCIEECTDEFIPSGELDGVPYHDCLRKCLEANKCWKMP